MTKKVITMLLIVTCLIGTFAGGSGSIYYSDNFAFTYEGDKPMYFEFVGAYDDVAYFDVYPLE